MDQFATKGSVRIQDWSDPAKAEAEIREAAEQRAKWADDTSWYDDLVTRTREAEAKGQAPAAPVAPPPRATRKRAAKPPAVKAELF